MTTFTLVQAAKARSGGAGSLNTALGSIPQSGRMLVAFAAAGAFLTGITDSGGTGTWSRVTSLNAGGGVLIDVWKKLLTSTPGSAYSATGTFSGGTYCTLYLAEFSTDGTFTGNAASSTTTGSSATQASPSLATSWLAGLAAVFMNQTGGDDAGAPTAVTWTLGDYNDDGATDGYSGWSYNGTAQAAGTYATSWTVPANTDYGAITVAFEITAGGGGGPAFANPFGLLGVGRAA